MLTIYDSQKIKVISLVCIILVLYIHSDFHDYTHEIAGMPFNHYLQDAISGQIGRCAVPMFYMISGFLFFQNVHTMDDVWMKMRKRVCTLLVPYVIAALFMPLFLVVMDLLPFVAQFNNGSGFIDNFRLPTGDIVSALFYKAPGSSFPLAFHLWFLRDLIIVVAVSPLLYIIRKCIGGGNVVALLFISTYFDVVYIPIYALFWFVLGDNVIGRLHKFDSPVWIGFFVFLSIWEVVFSGEFWHYLKIPIIFTGIVSIWNIYDRFVGENFNLNKHRWLLLACQFTFFIYLFHEPTLNVVRKLLLVPLGHTSLGFALDYILSPWIFMIMFVGVGYYFRKHLPWLYGICVGGR